jgi:hypothetical protein
LRIGISALSGGLELRQRGGIFFQVELNRYRGGPLSAALSSFHLLACCN